jgi:putative spermidine/putrescine transport system permease protein
MLGRRSPFAFLLVGLSAVALAYLLLPLLVIVLAPLGDTGYLAFPPQGLTLRWYQAPLRDPRYLASLSTSLTIATIVAALSTGLGALAAYALARGRFPGRAVLEGLFLSPLILPTLVLAVGLSLWFARLGLIAGTTRLVAAHLLVCTPYVIRVTLPVFRRFDRSLEEAALNLGASPFATFTRVFLPVVRPALLAAAAIAFVTSFDEVVLALFLADPKAPTLPVMIYSAVQLGFEPSVAAMSGLRVIAATVLLALFLVVSGLRERA